MVCDFQMIYLQGPQPGAQHLSVLGQGDFGWLDFGVPLLFPLGAEKSTIAIAMEQLDHRLAGHFALTEQNQLPRAVGATAGIFDVDVRRACTDQPPGLFD